ncbi:long-chain specific acyl-CoA dehydrogenase, mitochondrial-like [Amphiura filiformis]|uniref:long-chain specific acyl-CoA dehydrogenase, mitochondrial-like n=1 Tax=Amphiura filiformis TaxID=82378 RepID=UPI003B224CE6
MSLHTLGRIAQTFHSKLVPAVSLQTLKNVGLRQLWTSNVSQRPEGESQTVRPEIGQASSMLDIGTRSIFGEEHDIFRQNLRRFFQEEVAPHQQRWEKAGHVDKEIWEKYGAAGLLGISVPAEHGGVGGDVIMACIAIEEQMYANGVGPAAALHGDIIMPYISQYGTKEQREKYLPEMMAGRMVGAIAMTEPSAGSDLQGIKTYAVKDGDDWILNGSKVFITNGFLCDVVIVVAITDLEAKHKAKGISLFIVENGTEGFTKGSKPLEKIGQKATDAAELYFQDVRLPANALLGKENHGFFYLMNQLPWERLIIADMGQSQAECMFELTRMYVKERKAFGSTLSNFQTVQHKLAELKTNLCVGRSFVDNCIGLMHNKRLDSVTASMAKYWCTEFCNRVATECLQLHGGWGYMWEYPIARHFADSRVHAIYGGSNEIMKELIARDIVLK